MAKKTIIVFSGDYDKVMAAFIIANGAVAMGDDVTMFFTFWGLSALRRPERAPAGVTASKSALQKGFGALMPRGPERLGLSKFNFGGMGQRMMKKVMRQENVMPLPELIDSARELGVRLIACTMSMDVMGISKEELVDDLEYAGVATYLDEADESNVNLFI
ncbi:MAG: DsrE/DsrF/DrsH-like family protein [Candidatus Nanopelagicales bacterium]